MGASIQSELFRNKQTAKAIRVLLEEFEGGEFTSREGKALLRKHCHCTQFDTLNNNNWFEVSRVEYFDLPDCDPTDVMWRFTLDNGTVVVSRYHGSVGDFARSGNRYHEIFAVEKLENVQPQGKRYYYKVREDYRQKMAREFVSEEDIENAMRKIQRKLTELEAHYDNLKALKAAHFVGED